MNSDCAWVVASRWAVAPAQAGAQFRMHIGNTSTHWVPAFAGTTCMGYSDYSDYALARPMSSEKMAKQDR